MMTGKWWDSKARTVSTCWFTCCKITVAGTGALATYGGSTKEGKPARMGVEVRVVIVVVLLVVDVVRTMGEEAEEAAPVCVPLSSSMMVVAARLRVVLVDVVKVVVDVDVAKTFLATARTGGWRCMMVVVGGGEGGCGEAGRRGGGRKAAAADCEEEETQSQPSSKETARKNLVVVVVVSLRLCVCLCG